MFIFPEIKTYILIIDSTKLTMKNLSSPLQTVLIILTELFYILS